jgi:hypothetical protein
VLNGLWFDAFVAVYPKRRRGLLPGGTRSAESVWRRLKLTEQEAMTVVEAARSESGRERRRQTPAHEWLDINGRELTGRPPTKEN